MRIAKIAEVLSISYLGNEGLRLTNFNRGTLQLSFVS